MRQVFRLAACALVGATMLAAFSHPAAAAEKIKVTMAALSGNYAPYLVAIEKGYFKEEGFDVEVIKAGGGTATPALMSGSIDFSTSGSAAVSAIERGAPLRVIFYPWDRIPYQIWATTPAIKSLADLKGKQIGIISRGDTMEVAVRIALARQDMSPTAVSYTPLGYGNARIAAAGSGALPAVVLSTIDARRLKKSGKGDKAHMVYDLHATVKMPLTGTAVSAKALSENPDRVKRFLRAVEKGLAYTAAFPEPTVDILTKYNPKTKREALADTLDETLAGKTDGTISEELQRQEATTRAEVIGLAKDKVPPLDKIYDFHLTKQVVHELAAANWKPVR